MQTHGTVSRPSTIINADTFKLFRISCLCQEYAFLDSRPATQRNFLWWWKYPLPALFNKIATNHTWLLSSWKMASATEGQPYTFYLILINVNVNSRMWWILLHCHTIFEMKLYLILSIEILDIWFPKFGGGGGICCLFAIANSKTTLSLWFRVSDTSTPPTNSPCYLLRIKVRITLAITFTVEIFEHRLDIW